MNNDDLLPEIPEPVFENQQEKAPSGAPRLHRKWRRSSTVSGPTRAI